jgi:hypothetical protein
MVRWNTGTEHVAPPIKKRGPHLKVGPPKTTVYRLQPDFFSAHHSEFFVRVWRRMRGDAERLPRWANSSRQRAVCHRQLGARPMIENQALAVQP